MKSGRGAARIAALLVTRDRADTFMNMLLTTIGLLFAVAIFCAANIVADVQPYKGSVRIPGTLAVMSVDRSGADGPRI